MITKSDSISGDVFPACPAGERSRNGRAQALVQKLEQAIRSRELPDGHRLPSVRELAAVHGVSYGAALRALEHLERKGLVQRMHGSGTYVRFADQPGQSSHTAAAWATIFADQRPHMEGSLNTELLLRLSEARLAVYALDSRCGPEQHKHLTEMWRQQAPRAVIVAQGHIQIEHLIERYCPQSTRVIRLRVSGGLFPGWHSVCPDRAKVGRMAVEHLAARGHRRIGLLTKRRQMNASWIQNRRKAWMPYTDLILGVGHAMRDAGLERGLSLHYNAPVNRDPSGPPVDEANVAAMAAWLTGPEAPTAVITDDFRVAGLRLAAVRAGRRIGEDLHLVSFGASILIHHADHPTIDLRYDMLAREAVALATCSDEELGDTARHIVVPPKWVHEPAPPGT